MRNGTETLGLAGKAVQELAARGYQQVFAGSPGISRAVTAVGYGPGHQGDAEQIARFFPTAEVNADAEADTVGVAVELGDDYLAAGGPSSANATPTVNPGNGPGAGASGGPSAVPQAITDNTRTADTDVCTGLTYG